jgi:L-fuconolactonase
VPALVGIRSSIDRDAAAGDRPSSVFLAGIATLTAADLAFDLLIRPPELPLARNLVAAAPEQRFVLDHLAKPPIKDQALEPWASDIRQLARLPNVACKLSGMVTEANLQAWQPADFTRYLDIALDAFGPERLMVGSDWPVCRQAAEYGIALDIVRAHIAGLSSDEQDAILGETAMTWYGIVRRTKAPDA